MIVKEQNISILGTGIYSIPETARLTQMSQITIKRWVKGYRFVTKWKGGQSQPIFTPHLPEIEGHLALSFMDLIEIFFVKAFRDSGVQLPTIRRAAQKAARLWQTRHPFCVKRLKTDGRSIFASIESQEGDLGLMDLAKSQWTFERVINPYLTQVEYDEVIGDALRWWPLGRSKPVVVDPKFAFGRPVVVPGHVPTEDIYNAVQSHQSIEDVAKWLEIPPAAVRAAVQFEESLAA